MPVGPGAFILHLCLFLAPWVALDTIKNPPSLWSPTPAAMVEPSPVVEVILPTITTYVDTRDTYKHTLPPGNTPNFADFAWILLFIILFVIAPAIIISGTDIGRELFGPCFDGVEDNDSPASEVTQLSTASSCEILDYCRDTFALLSERFGRLWHKYDVLVTQYADLLAGQTLLVNWVEELVPRVSDLQQQIDLAAKQRDVAIAGMEDALKQRDEAWDHDQLVEELVAQRIAELDAERARSSDNIPASTTNGAPPAAPTAPVAASPRTPAGHASTGTNAQKPVGLAGSKHAPPSRPMPSKVPGAPYLTGLNGNAQPFVGARPQSSGSNTGAPSFSVGFRPQGWNPSHGRIPAPGLHPSSIPQGPRNNNLNPGYVKNGGYGQPAIGAGGFRPSPNNFVPYGQNNGVYGQQYVSPHGFRPSPNHLNPGGYNNGGNGQPFNGAGGYRTNQNNLNSNFGGYNNGGGGQRFNGFGAPNAGYNRP